MCKLGLLYLISQSKEITMPALATRPAPVEIDFDQTALVIVDMQNAFVTKGGMFDLAGIDISGAPAVIEANRRLLAASRKAGLLISTEK